MTSVHALEGIIKKENIPNKSAATNQTQTNCITFIQRLRSWSNIVQNVIRVFVFVFAGKVYFLSSYDDIFFSTLNNHDSSQMHLRYLTLSSLNLPLSSSSTTSRELLSQLPTCSG